MKNKIIMALAILSLVACNKKDSDKKPTDTSRALVSKPELTLSQKEEIKGIFAGTGKMPRLDYLTDDVGDNAEKKRALEEKIKALGSEEKQIYDKLKADCQIGKAERKETGDLKTKGSKLETKWSASISGDKCPIDHKWTSSKEATVTAGTTSEDQTVSATTKTENSVIFKLQDIQTQVGVKEVSSTQSGSETHVTKGGKSSSLSAKDSMIFKVTTAKDQKIKCELTVDMKEDADTYIRIDYEFPNSNPTIQAFHKKGDKDTQYYLNGKEITSEKLAEIFSKESVPTITEGTTSEISKKFKRLF